MSIRTFATTLVMCAALSGLPPSRIAAHSREPAERADVDATASAQRIRAMDGMVVTLGVTTFFVSALFAVGWIARAVMDHRRWMTALKAQTDAHMKVFDRLASNEELLAYIQSPAGQRLLIGQPAAPSAIDAASRAVGAPVGRILWSAQTGLVLAFAGGGLWLSRTALFEEAAQALGIIATLTASVGIGFLVSAVASYGLSRHLGLLHTAPDAPHA